MGTHFTLSERTSLQQGLDQGESLYSIAKGIHRPLCTVTREVSRHRECVKKGAYGRCYNDCIYRKNCDVHLNCGGNSNCTKRCSTCPSCNSICPSFSKESCPRLEKSPYVCNGCPDSGKCTLTKYFYNAEKAHAEYESLLRESREGMNLTETEYRKIDDLVSPLLKQGQSIKHICNSQKDNLFVSESTLYRIVDRCKLGAKNIDMPRKCRFKVRSSKPVFYKVDKACLHGRTFEDYLAYQDTNQSPPTVQADSVEGVKGGKVFLTLLFTNCNLQLGYTRESNTSQSVIDVFDELYRTLGAELFSRLFPVILADNGTEFSNPRRIEASVDNTERSKLFYCHPSSPQEKGKCENNHELVRRIFPKGSSLDDFTQEDIDLAFSHINSYGRPKFNGKSPAELFVEIYGEETLHLLRQTIIPPEKIVLKPSLMKH